MIKLKIVIATSQRSWFDQYAECWNDRVRVLASRTIHNRQVGQRDFIIIHGKLLHLVQFAHYLGNKHCRILAVKYQVTPYAVPDFKN